MKSPKREKRARVIFTDKEMELIKSVEPIVKTLINHIIDSEIKAYLESIGYTTPSDIGDEGQY
jgi:hypothetical protein